MPRPAAATASTGFYGRSKSSRGRFAIAATRRIAPSGVLTPARRRWHYHPDTCRYDANPYRNVGSCIPRF